MIRKVLLITALSFTLIGCGLTASQKLQVAQFGKATDELGTFSGDEMTKIRQDVYNMNIELAILASKSNFDKDKLKRIKELDKPIDVNDLKQRVAAANALKNYGDLLNKLAIADRTEPIKKAAANLLDSFNSGFGVDLTSEQQAAAAGIITTFGTMWIENEKKKAVKKIVTTYQQPINKVADLLTNDFKAKGEGFLAAMHVKAIALKTSATKALTGNPELSFADKQIAFNAYSTAEQAIKRVELIGSKSQKILDDFKKSHEELILVVTEENYTADDIKNFAKSIQELVKMSRILTGI